MPSIFKPAAASILAPLAIVGAIVGAVMGALVAGPPPAAAAWEFRTDTLTVRDSDTGGGEILTSLHAWARSEDGNAVVEVTCSAGRQVFVTLDYVGFDTSAGTVRVLYQVDGLNPIVSRWQAVESPLDTLTAITTNPVYTAEMVRRLIAGDRLVLDVETLPRLRFDLVGSRAVLEPLLETCEEERPLR